MSDENHFEKVNKHFYCLIGIALGCEKDSLLKLDDGLELLCIPMKFVY